MIAMVRRSTILFFLAAGLFLFSPAPSRAQSAYGPIRVEVDETRAPQKLMHTHLQMPVHPGPLTLFYPEWIPGEHMPDGPIIEMAGLKFTGDGKTIPWRRDLVDMFAFHLDIPQGVSTLDVDFDFLLSAPAEGYSAGASATAYLNLVSWNQVVLYPQGYDAANINCLPSLRIPSGWKFGTALPGPKQSGDVINFDPVTLETLIDSPVLTGLYFRAIELTPGKTPLHEMDIAADSAADLEMTPEMQMDFHRLVEQAGALFGSRHYRDYHFLVTLSDDVAHFGLEHHESSDDRTRARSLIDEAGRIGFSGLLPHEYVHSWNGKYRRPEGLLSPDYHKPMKDDLLWVYEGLTEYLGYVLTARSGLLSEQQSREDLARLAGQFDSEPGRQWRPLQDTADSAVFLYGASDDWSNWRRGVDFYEESLFMWLDVDSNIRRLTNDKKSMNDFCRLFHGGTSGEPDLKPYNFDDVVSALNTIAPYDWKTFLRSRLDGTSTNTPVEATQDSGWRIVYNDQPNEIEEVRDSLRRRTTLQTSIGLLVENDGRVVDVRYDGPAFNAGMAPGMRVTAVNGQQFSPEAMINAIEAAKSASSPIELIVANGQEIKSYAVDYHGGLRYPHLVRDESYPDYLGEILHPLAP